jgi:hypothetical protein
VALERPVDLTEVCVQAAFEGSYNQLGPKVLESPLLGYKRVRGGFEGAWLVRRSR